MNKQSVRSTETRREFLKESAAGTAGLAVGLSGVTGEALARQSSVGAKILGREKLVEMLRLMRKIRHFEEALTGLYNYESFLHKNDLVGDAYDFASTGDIAGAVHLSIGQEATEVGTCAALSRDDYVTSTHRGHGHCIAKGADVKPMMAELMGRKTGYSKGCGGSMHIFCSELGLLGGNGIVGAQIPLATGAAFAAKYQGSKRVAVAFLGEGASNQGTFHEALNIAALWSLPVIFVCENNLYAASTPAEIALANPDVADRAAGYLMPGKIVDGQDIMAVHRTVSEAVERAREGAGPTLIECKTYRFRSHAGGGRGMHNNPEELKKWLSRDPITLFEKRLVGEGVMSEEEQQAIKTEAIAEVNEAVDFARRSAFPELAELPVIPGTEL